MRFLRRLCSVLSYFLVNTDFAFPGVCPLWRICWKHTIWAGGDVYIYRVTDINRLGQSVLTSACALRTRIVRNQKKWGRTVTVCQNSIRNMSYSLWYKAWILQLFITAYNSGESLHSAQFRLNSSVFTDNNSNKAENQTSFCPLLGWKRCIVCVSITCVLWKYLLIRYISKSQNIYIYLYKTLNNISGAGCRMQLVLSTSLDFNPNLWLPLWWSLTPCPCVNTLFFSLHLKTHQLL